MFNTVLGELCSAVNKAGKFPTLQNLHSECLCKGRWGRHNKQIKNNTGFKEYKIKN